MNRKTLLIPDIAWVEIPAGPFLYGEGTTQRTLELPAFWIAKYPVTNCQYRTFIDAGGYAEERWWRDLVKPQPETSRWPQTNRPKTNMNWYETVAFCRWFSAVLGYPGDSIRLPSGQEWEKAACGEKAWVYPWGDEYRSSYANVNEVTANVGPWNLGEPTAVGMYPHGASSFGVEDLAGNIWEWCQNKGSSPELPIPYVNGEFRTMRGGSWFNHIDLATTSYKYFAISPSSQGNWGFRIVSSIPMG